MFHARNENIWKFHLNQIRRDVSFDIWVFFVQLKSILDSCKDENDEKITYFDYVHDDHPSNSTYMKVRTHA